MNTPGQEHGNWAWRFRAAALTDALGQRLRELTELYGRSPAPARRDDAEDAAQPASAP
jgi:4-alpha-glucanotransferase